MGGMMLMMLLFWLVPIALVVWALSGVGAGRRTPADGGTPLEILRRRYASGEISQEQYEEQRRLLLTT